MTDASVLGHREPIVPGLLIGAKKARGVIFCKTTCDWLIIKMNLKLFLFEEKCL